MLASVLPGLREIRAPLAAGFVWLAFLWVCLGSQMPSADEATGLLKRVYDLSAYVGVPSTLAALTFIAYLVGATWEVTAVGAKRFVGGLLAVKFGDGSWIRRTAAMSFEAGYSPDTFVSRDTRARLDAYLDERSREVAMSDKVRVERATALLKTLKIAPAVENGTLQMSANYYSRLLLLDETEGIGRSLQSENDAIFAEYDRLRAEGRFRLRLATPTILLIVAASYQTSWFGLCLVAIPLLLWLAGRRDIRAANDLLMRQIANGKVESVWMNRLFGASRTPARQHPAKRKTTAAGTDQVRIG